MKQQTFKSFKELLDFLRYVEAGVSLTYVSQDSGGEDVLVLEISEQDWFNAKAEYEADTYNNYDYI